MKTRRDFIKSSGMLVVGIAATNALADAFVGAPFMGGQNVAGPYPDPTSINSIPGS